MSKLPYPINSVRLAPIAKVVVPPVEVGGVVPPPVGVATGVRERRPRAAVGAKVVPVAV